MNEQLNPTKTFFGACPHDCPDTCAMIYEVDDGKLVHVKGNKEHPITRGTLCVKLKDFHDHHHNPDRLMYPLTPRGPQGFGPQRRQQLRAHHLGRSDHRDRPSLARHHRRVRRSGDHAAELSRQHGPGAGHQLGGSVLQSPRVDGEREDLLHLRLLVGLAADLRADRRRRPRELRALQVHRHLGVQLHLHQPASLAVCARGAEARCQGRGRRRLQVTHGEGRRLAHLPAVPAPTARSPWASSTR